MSNPILKNIRTGEIIEINSVPFTIGRGVSSNYVIGESCISRHHCSLNNTEDGWILSDNSTNGTFVNNIEYKMRKTPILKEGDEISPSSNYTYIFSLNTNCTPAGNDTSHVLNRINNVIPSSGVSNEFNSISDEILNQEYENYELLQRHNRPNALFNLPQSSAGGMRLLRSFESIPGSSQTAVHDTSTNNASKRRKVLDSLANESSSEHLPKSAQIQAVEQSEPQITESTSKPQSTENCSSGAKKMQEEMEEELTCTICVNLFIKPVTLGCSHTFCQYCIETWRSKKSECPICRDTIRSCNRTLVLDNLIDKFMENATEDEKKQRTSAVEERNNVEKNKKETKESVNIRNRNLRGQPSGSVVVINDSFQTIDSDSDSFSDLSDYYDNVSEGFTYPAYGQWGRCYNCGRRGHWRNRCPY